MAGDRGEADELWQSRNPPSPPQPASLLVLPCTIGNKIFHPRRTEFGLCRGTAARGSFVAKYPGIQHTMRTAGGPKCHKIGQINFVAAAFFQSFSTVQRPKQNRWMWGRQCRTDEFWPNFRTSLHIFLLYGPCNRQL